ncbi:MAG: S26 family signal peptidase [Pseudomonadota bacterium]
MTTATNTRRTWRRLGVAALVLGAIGTAKAALAYERSWYVTINWTGSLPHWAFLVDRRAEPQVGDFIDFIPPENPYYQNVAFVKRIAAGPGDFVSCQGRAFSIGGEVVAIAKEVSQEGDLLALGPCGVVPDGHYFVLTPHKDSFDSRYQEIGYVARDRVRGVARPIL